MSDRPDHTKTKSDNNPAREDEPVFRRKKDVAIRLGDGSITVTAHMSDNFHEMEAQLDISIPGMVIQAIRGRTIRVPHKECPRAVEALSRAVGLEVKKGLTQRMEETIGGKDGCSHLTNLVMEACHASVQGQYLSLRDRFGDLLDEMTPTERNKWFLTMRPQFIDSCVAYRHDSPIVTEAQKSPMTDRITRMMERIAAAYKGKDRK